MSSIYQKEFQSRTHRTGTPYQPMPEFVPIGGREVDESGNRSLRMVA